MLRAGKMLEQHRGKEALEILEAERARGASVSETAMSFAGAYQMLGRDEDALKELEGLLALEPENTAALLLKAQLLDDGGDLEKAVAVLERVTTLQPNYGGAFAAKGRKLKQLGFHEPAVAAMRRALELGVSDYELRYALGQSLIVLKRWPEVKEIFTALVAERADHGDAWLGLALARQHTGDLDGGDEALARAKAAGNASPRLTADVQRVLQGARERRAKKAGGDHPEDHEDQ